MISAATKAWFDSIVYEFFSMHVSEDMEEEYREKRREESRILGRSIFDAKKDVLWTGYAGEELFKRFCKKFGIEAFHHDMPGKKNLLDFTVQLPQRKMKIDVKTKNYDRYPPLSFRVDYNEKQCQNNRVVTDLVFAGYVKANRAIHLTCWNTKPGFIRAWRFYDAGEMMFTPEGHQYRVTDPMRIADIKDNFSTLHLLETLTGKPGKL